ncbi:hypothetical protein [Corynebacterium ulcerans]|uniref:hypothetical protein n=1 Tax=Corynebacterium ulcerans TaxID=65058 RepID=UPI0034A18067
MKIRKITTKLAVAAIAVGLTSGVGVANAASYGKSNLEWCKQQFPKEINLCEYMDSIHSQAEKALRKGDLKLFEALQADIRHTLLLLRDGGKNPIPIPHQAQ